MTAPAAQGTLTTLELPRFGRWSRPLPLGLQTLLAACLGLTAVLGDGCARRPVSVLELRDQTVQAADEVRAAVAARNRRRALDAATRARNLAESRKSSSECIRTQTHPPADVCREIYRVARQAQDQAERLDEEVRLRDLTTGLKAKAYWAARGLALKALLKALELAVVQARDRPSNPDLAKLSEQTADWAERLVRSAAVSADGRDTVATLERWSAQPPPQLGLMLTAGFAFTARAKPALWECEALDRSGVQALCEKDDVDFCRSLHSVIRGLVLSQNGLRHLAIDEFERLAAQEHFEHVSGAEIGAFVHGALAFEHLMKRDLGRADAELARALQLWPENPLAVYVTGERLAADGELERSAETLEQAARGTHYERVAKALAERAKEVRDSRGDEEQLFTDGKVVRELFFAVVCDTASSSKPMVRLREWVNLGEGLGVRLLAYLPQTFSG